MITTLMPPSIHHFKVWPEFFSALEDGTKTHEIRVDDRMTKPRYGDIIVLKCWDPKLEAYSGHEIVRQVSWISDNGAMGLREGHYVMSLCPYEQPR